MADTLINNLRAAIGREQVLSEAEELLVYESDGLTHYKFRPRAVVFPRSTEEVSEVVRVLAREGVSFAPRGAGTGLSGGALTLESGVCIELARMRRLLKVDLENRLAVVETGMVNAQVSRAVARHGLHYVPDPSSQISCTVGGNVAENAGGIHCLKYGTTVDHVLGLRVVLSDGRVVELGGAGAAVGGFDLLGVFVGSEGTFGIATEATVRLTPIPPAVRTMLADFTDIDDASRAVSAIIAEGFIPAALEMVDGATIRAVEASVFAAGLPLDAEAALLVELDGLKAGLDEEVERIKALCLKQGARTVRLAADESERKKLWAARKGAFGAMGRISPDFMLQDAVVPRSRLPEVLAETYRVGAKYALRIANVFHAGDGNLHPLICYDARSPAEVVRVKEAGREIMETCVRAGGTITGEHGVGLDKRDFLPLIFSDESLAAMLRLRAAFDPTGRCNPGKIIPTPKGCGEARAVTQGRSPTVGEGTNEQATGNGRKPVAGQEAALSSTLQTQTPSLVKTSSALRSSAGAFNAERAANALASVVGHEHLKAEGAEGEILTVSPSTSEEVCEVLKLASQEGWKVEPVGAGRWLDAGNPLPRARVRVKTERLSRVLEHEPADLVATAEAGARLSDFNREVGRSGQWLALDPPGGDGATLGGVAATGLGGPQSFGYGLPRARVLGMRVALAGGTLIRAGGRVVKNVAGYDLCKLFVGSHGTLGVILELTLKLRPRPPLEATLAARSSDARTLLRAGRAVIAERLLPSAVELLSPRMAASLHLSDGDEAHAILVRFAGTPEAVAFQLERARSVIEEQAAGASVETFDGDDAGLWSNLSAAAWDAESSLVWRAGVLPSELGALLDEAGRLRAGVKDAAWHAGLGDGSLRVFEKASAEDVSEVPASLRDTRRAATKVGGSFIVERAPARLKREFDAWGLSPSAALLMKRVKEQLDPADTFSPGRFAFE
ncbi:MAG TPA: FAD-linked oxidase C-terminal domain-containing protein [Pyrinomonadaceae bacterium]|nr:FAD-linked oxidase C-terminal domain-containing protein [Pyrinomonadaceae bacterium]